MNAVLGCQQLLRGEGGGEAVRHPTVPIALYRTGIFWSVVRDANTVINVALLLNSCGPAEVLCTVVMLDAIDVIDGVTRTLWLAVECATD